MMNEKSNLIILLVFFCLFVVKVPQDLKGGGGVKDIGGQAIFFGISIIDSYLKINNYNLTTSPT